QWLPAALGRRGGPVRSRRGHPAPAAPGRGGVVGDHPHLRHPLPRRPLPRPPRDPPATVPRPGRPPCRRPVPRGRPGALRPAAAGRRVTLEEMSEPRRGQVFAFVMDTRLCDAAFALAAGADLVVCESTFLERDADLAAAYGHLTAAQAARVAAEAGARRLVLT